MYTYIYIYCIYIQSVGVDSIYTYTCVVTYVYCPHRMCPPTDPLNSSRCLHSSCPKKSWAGCQIYSVNVYIPMYGKQHLWNWLVCSFQLDVKLVVHTQCISIHSCIYICTSISICIDLCILQSLFCILIHFYIPIDITMTNNVYTRRFPRIRPERPESSAHIIPRGDP